VRIATHRFGKEYARGLPKFTFGKVIDIMGESTKVKWEQGDEDIVKHLSLKLPGHKGTTLAAISSSDLPVWDDPRKRRPDLGPNGMWRCVDGRYHRTRQRYV
jgi:hypothetical protein